MICAAACAQQPSNAACCHFVVYVRQYRLMLLQIKNVAAASNAALQHDVASLKRETEEMQSKLERSLQSFDTVQQEAQAVEGEVVDEVCLLTLCLFLQTCP